MRGKRTSPDAVARVCELYSQGVKVEAIAAQTGVGHDTIGRIAKQAGLPARKRGRPRKEIA